MDLPAPFAWLVDEAGASPDPDRFLAELGGRLLADGLPLAGGALTLAVPHPIIAHRTRLWRAKTGAVIEALGFTGGPHSQAGRDWLAGLGPVQQGSSPSKSSRRSVRCRRADDKPGFVGGNHRVSSGLPWSKGRYCENSGLDRLNRPKRPRNPLKFQHRGGQIP